MNDYERIRRAIAYIAEHQTRQPGLEEVAEHLHISPFHCQRLFRRWAGVSPKRFLQALTVERAKDRLSRSGSLLEVSAAVGLSGTSRLHDHFVQLEAVAPGEFRTGGRGLTVVYGNHDSPFGPLFVARTERGVCRLEFTDGRTSSPLAELRRQWPAANFEPDQEATGPLVEKLCGDSSAAPGPLSLHVTGTNFQLSVWKALLRLPPGRVTTYGQLAEAVGRPRAARAVGRAVGANPVALVIPCHRVIHQTGALGQYRWGAERKQLLLLRESLRAGATPTDAPEA